METTSALHSALDKYPSLITFWSSSSAASPATLLRPRHGKITAASGSNTRVPCAKRDVLPIRTAQNQRVSDRADNCGKRVAVGVARGRMAGAYSQNRWTRTRSLRAWMINFPPIQMIAMGNAGRDFQSLYISVHVIGDSWRGLVDHASAC